jgi:putative flippase GtrA
VADSLSVSPITGLYRRFADLIHELAKFGLVGGIAAVLDLGGAALLYGAAGVGELTAKTISAVVAATFAYAGNRLWTFRHRANAGLAREYLIFFALNGIGLLIALLVIGFTTYSLGLHGPLAYNVAQVTGTGIGTIFRYWAYKKWVFLPAAVPAAGPPVPPPPLPLPRRGAAVHALASIGDPDPGEAAGVFLTQVR